MRLLIILFCLSIYISVYDLILVKLITQQCVIPQYLGTWSLIALCGLVIIQFRHGLSNRTRFLHSLTLTIVALMPWAIIYLNKPAK